MLEATNSTCHFLSEPDQNQSTYNWIIWLRRGIIFVSSTALIINISLILIKKQYVYNTIKLLLFLESFYLLSQLSVVFQSQSFNIYNHKETFGYSGVSETGLNCSGEIANIMVADSQWKGITFCSLTAFLNLLFYSVSYFFAVSITYYVRRVLDNSHKNFMRRNTRKIIVFNSGFLLFWAIPFAFSFIPSWPYSYGPTGYYFIGNYYFLFCGLVIRSTEGTSILSYFHMGLIPFGLFLVHSLLLYKNWKSVRVFRDVEGLNRRQWFIIRSGFLSSIVFGIQVANLVKFILSAFASEYTEGWNWFLFIVNSLFDLCPLILVAVYLKRFYGLGVKLEESSLLRSQSDSLVTTSVQTI